MSTAEKTDTKPTIAFFGATGGCCNASLVLALKDGYHCSALARTPSKLTSILLSKGLSPSTLSSHLHITQGDIRSPPAVLATLAPNNRPVNMIISGIGMNPLSWTPDTTICASAASAILSALAILNPASPPYMAAISTTGISKGKEDVPVLCWPLYKILLHRPHADKRIYEDLLFDAVAKGALAGFTAVRPSLLTDGDALGEAKVRVGTEEEPAVGYSIRREDVGGWIFRECIRGGGDGWKGEKVSLTY